MVFEDGTWYVVVGLARVYHSGVALMGLVLVLVLGVGVGVGVGFGTLASMLELLQIELMRGAVEAVVALRMNHIGGFVYDTGEW